MPSNVTLAAFIFGAILVLLAILGGGFEIFGAKIPEKVHKTGRIISGTLGLIFIILGIVNPFTTINPQNPTEQIMHQQISEQKQQEPQNKKASDEQKEKVEKHDSLDNKKRQPPEHKQSTPQEVYHVQSRNQSGGITAGKIKNLNIITDKESLGIREPFGLYRNGKKVGNVTNPVINESSGIFTFDEIQFDNPLGIEKYLSAPFEFRNYIIQIVYIESVEFNMALATGIKGKIIKQAKN